MDGFVNPDPVLGPLQSRPSPGDIDLRVPGSGRPKHLPGPIPGRDGPLQIDFLGLLDRVGQQGGDIVGNLKKTRGYRQEIGCALGVLKLDLTRP